MATACPDRTKNYLLSLQSQYLENDFHFQLGFSTSPTGLIVPANPFRVMLVFSLFGANPSYVTMVTLHGTRVTYRTTNTFQYVQLNYQLDFLLPTFMFLGDPMSGITVDGFEIVKQ